MHEDLQPRLVLVVAPAAQVVDVQDRLQVGQQVRLRQELPHHLADHRGPAKAAADDDLVSGRAAVVAHHPEADVMRFRDSPVVRRPGDADLELARQVEELRMVGRPLPQQLRRRPRILDLVGRRAGEMVRRHVADAVAAGLDRVHLDVGQRVEDVRHVAQLRPVELDVLPRGEVPVALVPALGDHRRAAAACANSACRRESRPAACRHGAAGRARSSAAAAGTPPRSATRRSAAPPGRGTRRPARARNRGRNRYSHTSERSACRPCWG